MLLAALFLDGHLRRLVQGDLDLTVFFLKDAICLALWWVCWPLVSGLPKRWLKTGILVMMVALLPSIILTIPQDPWLALYGLKQRVLPIGAALAVFVVCSAVPSRLKLIGSCVAGLLAVSGLLAVGQTFLPVAHWLNCGPEGALLPPEHIKAGIPRVSSTFPFFAQYSYFLNFALPVSLGCLALVRSRRSRFLILLSAALGMAGALAANSRSAVFGPCLIIVASLVVLTFLRHWRAALGCAVFLAVVASTPWILRSTFPQAMAGYTYRAVKAEQRSGGNLQDITFRLLKELNPATLASSEQTEWFGSRLGSQSRGTELFSSWAATIRATQGWAETPLAATFLETSWWGLVTGAAIRLAFVIWLLSRVRLGQGEPGFVIPLFGFVMLVACIGGIDFQFPLACWFWLGIGLLLAHLHTPLAGAASGNPLAELRPR